MPTKKYRKRCYEDLVSAYIKLICGELGETDHFFLLLEYEENFADYIEKVQQYTPKDIKAIKKFIHSLRASGDATDIYDLEEYMRACKLR